MSTERENPEQFMSEVVRATNAILLKSFAHTQSYSEMVEEYRRIEVEFVARMGGDESGANETKRYVAELIFSLAHSYTPSFEVSRQAWNDLVRLGFPNLSVKCMNSWLFGDLCAWDEQPEAGLAVLQPLIEEVEQWIGESRATQRPTMYYKEDLEALRNLGDELEAQRMGKRKPERITRRLHEAYYKAHELTPEAKTIDDVYAATWEARRAVRRAFARSRGRSFAEIAADYLAVETDVVARALACEAIKPFARKLRNYNARAALRAACGFEHPFEVCHDAWNEAVRLGFSDFEEQCRMTGMYAESCGFNQKPKEGLAVLEPLLVDLEQGLKAKELTRKRWLKVRAKRRPPPHEKEPSPSFYRSWLGSLTELRDKLLAQRSGP